MTFDTVTAARVDAADNLWMHVTLDGGNAIALVANAAAATTSTGITATFPSPSSFAFDPDGGRLFAGLALGGSSLVVWNNAAGRTGNAGPSDFTLESVSISAMDIASDRLFAAMSTQPTIRVWNNVHSINSARGPDFTIDASTAIPGGGNIIGLRVLFDTLVVVKTGIGGIGETLLIPNASTLTATPTILAYGNANTMGLKGSWLDSTGTLYSMTSLRFTLFRNVFGTSSDGGLLPGSNSTDLLVAE
jgi:hypothetical protein